MAPSVGFVVEVIEFLFTGVEGFSETKPVEEKSPILDFSNVFCPSPLKEPTSSEGFGKLIFLRELGLWLISGKKDSPVFSSFSDRS